MKKSGSSPKVWADELEKNIGKNKMNELFTFSEALAMIKDGMRLSRKNWNGKGMYIELYTPEFGSELTNSFICINTVSKKYIPWLASQEDLLSNDWFLI